MSTPTRDAAMRAVVECWQRRFPDLAAPWVHQSEDGTRIWLTDGTDGPVLAMHTLPRLEQEEEE